MTTHNEIVKALDICSKSTNGCSHSNYTCEDCYLNGQPMCLSVLLQDTIGHINRQKAETERLKSLVKEADGHFSKGDFANGIAIIIILVKEMEGVRYA